MVSDLKVINLLLTLEIPRSFDQDFIVCIRIPQMFEDMLSTGHHLENHTICMRFHHNGTAYKYGIIMFN